MWWNTTAKLAVFFVAPILVRERAIIVEGEMRDEIRVGRS